MALRASTPALFKRQERARHRSCLQLLHAAPWPAVFWASHRHIALSYRALISAGSSAAAGKRTCSLDTAVGAEATTDTVGNLPPRHRPFMILPGACSTPSITRHRAHPASAICKGADAAMFPALASPFFSTLMECPNSSTAPCAIGSGAILLTWASMGALELCREGATCVHMSSGASCAELRPWCLERSNVTGYGSQRASPPAQPCPSTLTGMSYPDGSAHELHDAFATRRVPSPRPGIFGR